MSLAQDLQSEGTRDGSGIPSTTTSHPGGRSTGSHTLASTTANGSYAWRGVLWNIDNKLICRVQSQDVPAPLDKNLVLCEKFWACNTFEGLEQQDHFSMVVHPGEDAQKKTEWFNFLSFLWREARVAVCQVSGYELVMQSDDDPKHGAPNYLTVFYAPHPPGVRRRRVPTHSLAPPGHAGQPAANTPLSPVRPPPASAPSPGGAGPGLAEGPGHMHPRFLETVAHAHSAWAFGALAELIDNARDAHASRLEISIVFGEQPCLAQATDGAAGAQGSTRGAPSGSLSESEEGEMEDNEAPGSGPATVPMLCVSDNGCGMRHRDVVQMLSLGHEPPPSEEKNRIGRFGVGFKSGSMRLGNDVVVLTQSADSRSIAFLSRTLNQNRQSVEIPIISYRKRHGGGMALDLSACTAQQEQEGLAKIAAHTPFDQFRIGEEFQKLEEMAAAEASRKEHDTNKDGRSHAEEVEAPSLEDESGGPGSAGRAGAGATGTRIFILGLRKVHGEYELDWDSEPHNILIRSRRARSRPNQMCDDVPLDYNLRTYLKYLFLSPKEQGREGEKGDWSMFMGPQMDMTLQGVKAQTGVSLLAGCKKVFKYRILRTDGKPIIMRFGYSEAEKSALRCGIFLYWRGRLIEAYKRVGRMEFGYDSCLGVLGVADTTYVLDGTQGGGVVNCKQRFLDTPEYEEFLTSLASRVDLYWDKYLDPKTKQVVDPSIIAAPLKDKYDWVQCTGCNKWRRIPVGQRMPEEKNWFCPMPPVSTTCDAPEDKEDHAEITLAITNHGVTQGRRVDDDNDSGGGAGEENRRGVKRLSGSGESSGAASLGRTPVAPRSSRQGNNGSRACGLGPSLAVKEEEDDDNGKTTTRKLRRLS